MDREIKFRGLRTDNKQWIYGGLVKSINNSFNDEIVYRKAYKAGILFESHYVYDETVGQYTGLKDKNGVPIYEGDLLHRHLGVKWKVVFKNSTWIADGNDSGLYLSANQFNECEVIGNIHEK